MWLELQGRLSARDCERPVFTEVHHWLSRISTQVNRLAGIST